MKTPLDKEYMTLTYKCKSPDVFLIPLDVYGDEMEKERDKEAFRKLQKLERNCEQLRQKLHSYSKEHMARVEITKYLVWRSMDFRNRRLRRT